MKKRIFFKLVLSLGLCLAFIRCSDDIIDSTYAGSDDFSAEAQSYFERTAEDIRLPRMSARRYELTRSTDLSSEVITPRWRKQKTGKYGKGDISTVEVPLAGNIYRRGETIVVGLLIADCFYFFVHFRVLLAFRYGYHWFCPTGRQYTSP